MAGRSSLAVGVALSMLVARGAIAVEVQLPAHTAITAPGQSATVALSIAPITTQDGVLAGAFSFTYAGAVATATGAVPGALLAACTTTTNLTGGRVTLIFACTQALPNGGTLFTVTFQGVAVGVSPLVFSATGTIPDGCTINEGTPSCQPSGGELVVGAPPLTATATATSSAAATATRTATPTASATGSVAATPTGGAGASGHPVQDLFRASDGTAYQLVRVLPQAGPAEAVRLTTVAGSAAGIGGCAAADATSGSGASAVVGPAAPAPLVPFATVRRTAVLLPLDAATIAFDSADSGRLRLGTGAGAVSVCASPFDCTGQPNVAPLAGLDTSIGGVAAGCVAAPLNAACDGGNQRAAFAFNLPATGGPPLCEAAPTADSSVCAAEPSDGFRLVTGQAMVFVYGDLEGTGVGVGIAGFGIDLDGANPGGCGAGQVVDAVALTTSEPAPPFPTATATAPPTPTRAALSIPVVSSPWSAAGLVMLAALSAAVVVALRRRGPI